ncbi:MAG: carbonic anhydrase, partial [Candidatus Krumholzibacteriia bacterium]
MRVVAISVLLAGLVLPVAAPLPAAGSVPAVAGEAAWQQLLAGNQRFVAGAPTRAHQDVGRRTEVANGQQPLAVIVGCADSRVPPEMLFDQGLGDLFVVRVAGEVVDDAALASIEYAVEHLGAGLIVVLGHERCGAVAAAVAGGEAPGHLSTLVKAIAPAVTVARGDPGDLNENAMRRHATLVASRLAASEPILAGKVR